MPSFKEQVALKVFGKPITIRKAANKVVEETEDTVVGRIKKAVKRAVKRK